MGRVRSLLPHGVPALALLALAASGCGTPPPASIFPDGAAALDRMKATFACVNGVQGVAKVDYFSPQGRVRGEVHLFAVNPARVRFDVVSPFGVMLATLSSNGRRFEMTDLQSKQFLHGPACAENLARLTQVPIPGSALVSLLRGEAPLLVHDASSTTIAWDDDGFYRVLMRSAEDATEEVHLGVRPDDWSRPWQEQRLRVLDVRVAQRGVDLYHVELDRHERASTAPAREDPDGLEAPVPPSGGPCDAELPRSIRMRVPNTENDVVFQYQEAHWNPPIVPGAFTQPVPGGVRDVYVGCREDGASPASPPSSLAPSGP